MSLSPVSNPIPRPIHHHHPITETNGATRPNPWRGRLSPGDDDDAPPSGMRRGTRLGPGLGIWPVAVVECPSLEISSWPPSPNGASVTNTKRASSGERHNALSLTLPAYPSAALRSRKPATQYPTGSAHGLSSTPSPDQSSKSDSLSAPIPAPAAGSDRPTEKQPKSHHHLPRADITHPTSPRTRTSTTTTTTATGQKLPPPETDRDFYTERHCCERERESRDSRTRTPRR